jgi:threonine aldolase
VRLVTAFNTKEEDVSAFMKAAQKYCEKAKEGVYGS